MLLTLSKPAQPEFAVKTHEYSPPFTSSTFARFSPKFHGGPLPPLPASVLPAMGTPHRGLPAITLPDPGRGPPPIPPPVNSLPPAPHQWQGSEEGMKNWLIARAEEDKRKQEEERTRQEGLKLEQRKIEQSILRESMQGGVPPHLVPMIFAGIGGANLANMSIDQLQQYNAQLQTAAQQQQQQQQQQQHQHQQAHAQAIGQGQLSPELRRETRLIGQAHPSPYGAPPTPQTILPPTSVLPGQPLQGQPQQTSFSASSYASGNMSPRARAAQSAGQSGPPTSAPRPPAPSQLPRLTTNEMHIQQPPVAPSGLQPLQQTQSAQQEQSSPSIYFHHWVPPTSQEKSSSGNPPATPSGKYKASPSFQSRPRAPSHASDPDYTSSPKKRKAQGGHQAPPPPTSAPQSFTSPSFSHISSSSASTPARRGHARARSDVSARGAEGHGASSLSRRGTISSHGHTETGGHQGETYGQQSGAEQQHQHQYQQPPRGPESHHQQFSQQYDQAHQDPQQRDDGRGDGQQARAATPRTTQAETRQSAPHHHLASHDRGSVPTSPKREPSGQ